MKKLTLIFFIWIILLMSVLINYKLAHSSYYQAFLMYDFNKDSYNMPISEFETKLDDEFPSVGHTALPIKFIKARYYFRMDSLEKSKELLLEASKANPFIKGPEELLAKIYLKQSDLDSSYFYSKDAFYNMPNVNPHRYTFFRVLQELNKVNELDSAFLKVKKRKNPAHWYDYIYTKFKLNNTDEKLKPLIDEFKVEFPNEDFSTIDEIENFINIGSESFTFSSALNSLADSKFIDENYTEAAELYQKAIDFNNEEYLYYENAAIAFDLSLNYDKAKEYYDIVLSQFKPKTGRAEFYLGLMQIKTNNLEEGCKTLREAVKKKYVGINTGTSAINVYLSLCGVFNN